ncbi:MAG: hypothetical protein R3F11_08435 [Verrucomicrobiales bacterium]
MPATIRCPKCQTGEVPAPDPFAGPGTGRGHCPLCRREAEVFAFPALASGPEPAAKARPAREGESACFHCPEKAAESACDGCGALICPDCASRWGAESLCLSCLHRRREDKGDPAFARRYILWDGVALACVTYPIFLTGVVAYCAWFLGFFGGPAALYLAIRHWKAPRGLVPRGPGRMLVAAALSVVWIAAALGLVGFIVYAIWFQTRS